MGQHTESQGTAPKGAGGGHTDTDVLAALFALASFGGTFGPREITDNIPRPTGLVANRARIKTAAALRSLQRIERAGLARCVGTGEQHCRKWNRSAADERERYWVLTDAALAKAGGES